MVCICGPLVIFLFRWSRRLVHVKYVGTHMWHDFKKLRKRASHPLYHSKRFQGDRRNITEE